jgi:RNA polymerase sigma-70 factor (ECF subfamily)
MNAFAPDPAGREVDDGACVERVRAGDRDAFAILVRRYQTSLYRHARALGLDYDAGHDAVQDAFVRAYTHLDACRDSERFRTWLFRILRNRCLDHLKDIRRTHVPLDAVTLADPDEASSIEDADALERAFRQLPAALREAFLLKHREGCSYEEIAERTGATVSALKMRVHRARDLLRATLIDLRAEP